MHCRPSEAGDVHTYLVLRPSSSGPPAASRRRRCSTCSAASPSARWTWCCRRRSCPWDETPSSALDRETHRYRLAEMVHTRKYVFTRENIKNETGELRQRKCQRLVNQRPSHVVSLKNLVFFKYWKIKKYYAHTLMGVLMEGWRQINTDVVSLFLFSHKHAICSVLWWMFLGSH